MSIPFRFFLVAFAFCIGHVYSVAAAQPNIVFVLFDDMGWGQPQSYNPESALRTPNFDRLAEQGMRFTDAHSAAAVCTPTRYGILTGRYPSRIGQFGVLTTYSPPIIPPTRMTIASMLKQHGYHTACIGKWHLGMNWVDSKPGTQSKVPIGAQMTGGPNELGFDYFCGFTHARNIGTIIEQDRVVEHVEPIDNQPRMIEQAVKYIDERANADSPFFLYFPMCPPHTPVVPSAGYTGKSGATDLVGEDPKYGDWVYQGDAMLGQILDAIERNNITENTLIVAASDNGAEHRAYPPLRASKRSIYEGGHRVPFVVSWPEQVKAGSVCDETICLNDFMATAAGIVGANLPDDAGEDSVSLLGLLRNEMSHVPVHEAVVHQSSTGDLAIRQGEWKQIFFKDGRRELYDLDSDLGEASDVATDNPDVTARLTETMRSYIDHGRSTPGPDQKNDAAISLAVENPNKRPNILFIIADDQSPFDFKFYNSSSSLDTPNIDRLAAQGMVFDAAYHMGSFSGAVCTPSRHMIMSGRTVWHLPIGPAAASHCPPNLEQNTLAAVFNRAGYDTMRTCKKGNSYPGANKQFTIVHDATKRGGTDETGSTWHGDQVMNFLNERETTKDSDPFLIYFGFSHPHDVRDGRPELLAKYGAINHRDKNSLPPANPKQPELPINYLPEHPFPHGHPGLRDEISVSGVWERRDEQTIRNELGRDFACSENIDIQVGRVLDKLKAMGELDNTWVIYIADHGMAIGRHGLQGKQNLYEHTWRVPFIVSGPGIKPGSRAPGNIYLLDTLATLCDIAGITAPESNEGISFKPVLDGKQETVRDVMYGVYCGGTKPGMRSVKQGDWKLIKYDVLDGTVRETQLFNLATNPHELLKEHGSDDPALTNLAGNPEYATKQAELEALLLAEMRRLDDPYRLWDQPDDKGK